MDAADRIASLYGGIPNKVEMPAMAPPTLICIFTKLTPGQKPDTVGGNGRAASAGDGKTIEAKFTKLDPKKDGKGNGPA
jgi:hypothetical protein